MSFTLPPADCLLSFSSRIPNVFVWVTVDDVPTRVYASKKVGRSALGVIEAKEGSRFEVHFADLRSGSKHPYQLELYVDGRWCDDIVILKTNPLFEAKRSENDREIIFEGQYLSETLCRPFAFGLLKTTDNDDEACDESSIKHLGSIQLAYRRCKDARPADEEAGPFAPSTGPLKIHEAMKIPSLSHQVTYGTPFEVPEVEHLVVDHMDSDELPWVVYEFTYHSTQFLQLAGHITSLFTSPPSSMSQSDPFVAVSSSPSPNTSASPSATSQQRQEADPSPKTEEAVEESSSSASTVDNTATLAQLRDRLKELRRDREIKELEDKIEQLAGGTPATASLSSSSKRIKTDPADVGDKKKEKVQTEKPLPSTSLAKGKGKAKLGVLVLDDSD